MKISGLHLLQTFQCTFECDHCFVFGSPFQHGTMSLEQIRHILAQARSVTSVEWVYFEGGEPTLYYPILLRAVQEAHQMGFKVGIVTNAYWADNLEDALIWLSPFAGLVDDLSVSSDLFHYDAIMSQQADNASQAAAELNIPLGIISIARPSQETGQSSTGQLQVGESNVMYRGRAAEKLVPFADLQPWENFTECPYEDFQDPGRLHIDPLGHMHICQGISIGNIFENDLAEIISAYDPASNPITGPLKSGGPVELVHRYGIHHNPAYADACHLCYETRKSLRGSFPHILTPDQVYGITE